MDGRTIFSLRRQRLLTALRKSASDDIEVALLPIGGYDAPTRRSVHTNPEEAVRVFCRAAREDFDALRQFPARLRTADEPPRACMAAARENGIGDKVLLLTEGMPVKSCRASRKTPSAQQLPRRDRRRIVVVAFLPRSPPAGTIRFSPNDDFELSILPVFADVAREAGLRERCRC
jgi:hypothetical protein